MTRWFRVYSELIDDPKFIKLGADLRSALLMTWCVAAGNDGILPPLDDVALKFRLPESKTKKLLDELRRLGFIDETDQGPSPHNWRGRQFQSDVSTDRVKRFRERQRNDNETFQKRSMKLDGAVTETAPEQIQSRTDTEQSAACAAPARDSRRKPKLPMPDIFPLSEKNRAYAAEKEFDPDKIERMFAKFKNYHQSKGSTFASWDAAWRTWVDNEVSYRKVNHSDPDDIYENVL